MHRHYARVRLRPEMRSQANPGQPENSDSGIADTQGNLTDQHDCDDASAKIPLHAERSTFFPGQILLECFQLCFSFSVAFYSSRTQTGCAMEFPAGKGGMRVFTIFYSLHLRRY